MAFDYALELLAHMLAALFVAAQKEHAHAVCARLGQYNAQRRTDLLEEFVRQLRKYTGAVAGQLVGAGCAAVAKCAQHVYGIRHQLMAGATFNVANHAYAACVVFKLRIV